MAKRKAAPLATSIIASVAMKAGMLKSVTITPEKKPAKPHTATPARQARTMAGTDACCAPATSWMSKAATTADNAIRLPTDKSMPPVMITRVMPSAMIATKVKLRVML